MEFILASASPRRRELLARAGLKFTVSPAEIDESMRDGEQPENFVRRISAEKARAVLARNPQALILAADTIVVVRGNGQRRILGKPSDECQARQMLAMLSGTVHEVLTAVTIRRGTDFDVTFHAKTEVEFAPLTPADIEAYLATGEPFDKAGAYGIQSVGGLFVKEVRGSYTNVVGLPVSEVLGVLSQLGAWRPEMLADSTD